MKKTYLIIGASAAGSSAIKTIKSLSPDDQIICITKENFIPYNKCLLNSYLANIEEFKNQSKLYLFDENYFEINKNITLIKNTQVLNLNPRDKRVYLSDGQKIAYDKLLIATGSRAKWDNYYQDNSYLDCDNVFLLHTLYDFITLKNYVKNNNIKNITLVGAGINGLESVWALILNNPDAQINIIEAGDYLLGKYLNGDIAYWLENLISSFGVNIYKQDKIKFINKKNKSYKIDLESGKSFESEIIVLATGATAEIGLLKDSGLIYDNAIETDKYLKTNDQSIFAAGDCTLVDNIITGEKTINYQWSDAVIQGSLAAQNMLGLEKVYNGVYSQVISSLFFKSNFFTFGAALMARDLSNIYDQFDENKNTYYRFLVNKDDCLIGFVIIGQRLNISSLKKAVLENLKFSKINII